MAEVRAFRVGSLRIRVFGDRKALGEAAAEEAADALRAAARLEPAAFMLASAISQDELLAALRSDASVPWSRLTAFHIDEYAGLPGSHPAAFRRYLCERFVRYVPLAAFHAIRGEAADLSAECARYAALLAEQPPAVLTLGIGINGHIAFNGPGVCRFDDPFDVKIVRLDEECRRQQVMDGAFAAASEVPEFALTVTVPRLMRVPRVIIVAPGAHKREAVRRAMEGPISPECPASILRTHPSATLYLDPESAGGLDF